MELTPEESKKINDEEKAPLDPVENPKNKGTRYCIMGTWVLVVILLMSLAWGGVTQTRLHSCRSNLSNTTALLFTTQNELNQANSTLQLYQETLTAAGITIHSGVQPKVNDMAGVVITLTRNPAVHNPTWEELENFILNDKTSSTPYPGLSYTCGDYARDLYNNAEAAGIRAAFVRIRGQSLDHSLNAFVTTDQGLVYIDSSGIVLEPGLAPPLSNDSIVALKSGTEYQRQFIIPLPGYTTIPLGIVDTIDIYW